jgi:hypothetical protein
VIAELVAVLVQGFETRGIRGAGGTIGEHRIRVGIAADDEPGHVDPAICEQLRGAGQRPLEDHVLELGRMRAEAVDPVVAPHTVKIDRDGAGRIHGFPPNLIT